jgi:hypothetical protein
VRVNKGIPRDEIEGVTQTLVRWKTVEAMRLYARIEPDQYADYVDMAANLTTETADTIPAGLPEVDPQATLAEDEAALAAIEAEVAARDAQRKRDNKHPTNNEHKKCKR